MSRPETTEVQNLILKRMLGFDENCKKIYDEVFKKITEALKELNYIGGSYEIRDGELILYWEKVEKELTEKWLMKYGFFVKPMNDSKS